MKRYLALAAALAFLFLGCTPPPPSSGKTSPGTIRVGSFNIESFGVSKIGRPNTLTILARIAAGYDALAIEEVGSNSSSSDPETCAEILAAYTARINEIAGGELYSHVQGDQYAIVFRKDKLELLASGPYSGSQDFTYRPLTAYFKTVSGNLDFVLLVVHTRPARASEEIPALKTAMAEIGALYLEPDVICLGDFNADGSYYPEGAGPDLEGFPFPEYITVIPNTADTTVAASSNTYDRMEITASMTSDYASAWGVTEPGRIFDLSACEGTERTAGTEAALSDHYPVWAQFYIDKDTD